MLKQIKFKNEVNEFSWDKTGQYLFVIDSSGCVHIFDG